MLKSAAFVMCALALLAGCRTGQIEPPPVWEMPEAALPSEVPPTNSITVAPPSPAPPSPSPAPPPITLPENLWISLSQWGQQQGMRPMQRLSLSPLESYALATPMGLLVVGIGSRDACWDGIEIKLGFAPQMIEREVFIHALDLRKNIEPLMRGFAPITNAQRVIVLDPGHGGAAPGAQSVVDGRYEKEFTLDLAMRLQPLLEREGWRVFLTRTQDVDVPLDERIAIADRHKADVFISLHFNSGAPNREPAGLEIYCLTPLGMPSSLPRGYEDDVSKIFPNNQYDEQNLQLACQLQHAILGMVGGADRGVGRARFMRVIREQNRPAVLIEGGYLSNPREARLIANPEHRQKLAEAIAKALE